MSSWAWKPFTAWRVTDAGRDRRAGGSLDTFLAARRVFQFGNTAPRIYG